MREIESNDSVGSLIRGPEVHVNFWHNRYFGMENEATNLTYFRPAKTYPTYFDPSESNGEVNFIKQQPQHIQFHHLSSKLQTEIKHSPSVGPEKFLSQYN